MDLMIMLWTWESKDDFSLPLMPLLEKKASFGITLRTSVLEGRSNIISPLRSR